MRTSTLPAVVRSYLDDLSVQPALLAVRVSADLRVVEWWGDPEPYLAGPLEPGMDLRTVAPYLDEPPRAGPSVIPFLNMAGGGAVHLHILPVVDGWYVLYLSATAEQRQRQALQQSANELRLLYAQQQRLVEDLVEARSELELGRDRAENASRRRGRFIARLSHELRTPLAAISIHARLLAARAGIPELAEHSSAIERCVRELAEFIDNALDQSRLEEGQEQLQLGAHEIRRLVADLSTLLAPLAAEKGLAFDARVAAAVPAWLSIDAAHLRQVLVNLLGNAIKFTRHGFVRIEADWQADRLTIAVSDSGPGIAPQERERIFQPYHRADADVRGAGLGLAITARIAELMHGELRLDSELGCGARFTLELPAPAVAAQPVPATPPRAGAAARTATVLVAEDDPDLQSLLGFVLGGAGYDVSFASSGSEALACALESAPDVVMLDLSLPEMDGVESARRLRAAGFAQPLLAMSATTREQLVARTRDAGFDAVLTKPFDPDELLATLRRLAAR